MRETCVFVFIDTALAHASVVLANIAVDDDKLVLLLTTFCEDSKIPKL